MKLKLFGDTTPIDWKALGVRMPFAPMHELAEKYKLERMSVLCPVNYNTVTDKDIRRTFETTYFITEDFQFLFLDRINTRIQNTMSALDQCTSDTICINLGGGYHHAGKYPNTGYAYSLINDIIWAVDYQLEQNKTVGIIDLDFHFGGGTYEYYNQRISITDHHHPQGILHKHVIELSSEEDWQIHTTGTLDSRLIGIPNVDKILLNIGTDWYKNDALFGQYGQMEGEDLLNVWKETVRQITVQKIPLAITMGGGYGDAGLPLYQNLIDWIQTI